MTYIPVSLTVLGCGNATGVPTVGCTCAVCRSPSVRNQRLRCSALLRMGRQQWLIDSGPDLRRQALAAGIDQIDGVLYTHPHSDHINGIDDLRAYCERLKTPIPVYGNPATLAALHHSYSYAFLPPGEFWHRPVLLPNLLPDGGLAANGVPIQGYDCPHGRMQSTVYRIGNIAWATDISSLTSEAEAGLAGVEYLFLDALREAPSFSHLSMEQAWELSQRLGARQTYLIHMDHTVDYDIWNERCPEGIALAYDALTVHTEFHPSV